jgi:type I restriction enzyme S subunit
MIKEATYKKKSSNQENLKNQGSDNKQGWEIKKLGDVCKVIAGQSPEGKFYNDNGNGLPFYQGKKEYGEKYLGEPTTWTTKITKEAEANDILMSVRAPVGPINFATQKICIGRGLAAIRATKLIDKEFLFNFLLKHESEIVGNTGAVFNSINKAQIEAIKIPLPPLPEQQRIVSILDEAFLAIERSRNNAEQNLKNAKELFESYLEKCLNPDSNDFLDNPDSKKQKKSSNQDNQKNQGSDKWEMKTLKELTTKIGSGATPRGGQESYKQEGISLVRSMNVHDWEFRERNLAFIDEKQAKELDGVTLQEEDVLLNITGASVARCCVFPKEYLPARVNQHVSIIRPKKELLDAKFLNLLLTSKPYKDQLLFTGEQGATRQAITKAQIEAFEISFPPLKEQQTIVRQLDALRAETQKLEAVYQKKIADLEELKKSILQKAFSGQLSEL